MNKRTLWIALLVALVTALVFAGSASAEVPDLLEDCRVSTRTALPVQCNF